MLTRALVALAVVLGVALAPGAVASGRSLQFSSKATARGTGISGLVNDQTMYTEGEGACLCPCH